MRTDNTFATLTYEDSKLPVLASSGLATLEMKHLQDWLKRLRKVILPLRVRYYAVGEYGDETERPHYHVALFGFPTCVRNRTRRRIGSERPVWRDCCPQCRMVGDTWGHGDVDLGTVEVGSAQYLAQYVTKKMTSKDDSRLRGRAPEFARMSLKPGIGADFMHEVASTLMTLNLEKQQGDVPSSLHAHGRSQPLGRYLRRRLRTLLGREPNAPQEVIEEYEIEMLPLLKAAQADPNNPSLKGQIIEAYRQKVLNMEVKSKLFKQGKSL